MHVRRQPGWLQSPVASLSARLKADAAPCPTGLFRRNGKQKGRKTVDGTPCAIRCPLRREIDLEIRMAFTPKREEGSDASKWDWCGSPPRTRTSNKRLQRPMCYRLHQRGIMGRAEGFSDERIEERSSRPSSVPHTMARSRPRAGGVDTPRAPLRGFEPRCRDPESRMLPVASEGKSLRAGGIMDGAKENEPVSPAIVPAIRHMTNGSGRH